MKTLYKHTQIGYIIIVVFLFILFLLIPLIKASRAPIPIVVFIILLLTLLLFPTLTIKVDTEKINLAFGIGIIRKSFDIKEIETYTKVKNPWYYGWGIHYTPDGLLYNVSGFNALEIKLKSGKKYRIGTDEPDKLFETLFSLINKTQ